MGIEVLVEGFTAELKNHLPMLMGIILGDALGLLAGFYLLTSERFVGWAGKISAEWSLVGLFFLGVTVFGSGWEWYLAISSWDAFWGHYYPYLVFHGVPLPWSTT